MTKHVSNLLKDYRYKRGIDQYEMVRDLDISRQTISRYENGRYERIPISSAFIIIDYLNINIEYAFNAFVLDGLNRYHFNLLKNEVNNRGLNISDDFFDLYSSKQSIQKLSVLKTPRIPTKELIDTLKHPLEIDNVSQSHDELIAYCINSLNPSEAKKAYSILKVIFDSDEAAH